MTECFYETLGVERGSDGATIKRAYRKLAMQYHPDRNPNDEAAEQRFKEISEAYDILKDDQKRAAYDRYGHAAFANGHGGGAQARGFDADSFSDIFDQFFGDMMGGGGGRGRGQSSARRGADLRFNLEISLESAFHGVTENIEVPTSVSCDDCSGTGAEEGSSPEMCPACQGAGKIRTAQGFFTVERTCPGCKGAGRVISSPCKSCHGMGRVEKTRQLSVKIPAGVEEGTRIRLAGEGEAGFRGGPAGDLYIFLSIRPHKVFEREGTTVYCGVPISMLTATLGGEIEVPTLGGGRAKVRIPEGTQTGRQFRLRNKGMPQINTPIYGDMIIEITVETPVNLTKAQKDTLRGLADELGEKHMPQSTGFFSKVKGLWDDLTD
ncbi:chaperone protein DnaJ [Iodidimonas gelatinilytica]|uniref:Chaperone protein DnaJ n=1 Tax=Iodidimonas gelatinilytica TaxID=1236966 RepID=A0A5A7MNN8_9PROT|nr:molecular chaperone DnaJ [Iodidimonas gelatinilytica]GEQ97466.1 chaperone protein DnaJ [Iodidimonas gelatinilytica]GER01632.1 chaperone protein DnaJ [Iodidimonas gelatinilytica]